MRAGSAQGWPRTAVPTAQRLAREEAFARLVAQELAGAYRTATVLLGDAAEAAH